MKPGGHTAVMADRARGDVDSDDAQAALWRKLEYFPTPPWAARAGGELITELDPGTWWCWEPACGAGHMAYGLADYFQRVYATDIHDHGSDLQNGPPLDFLAPAADAIDQADWIITNPPFAHAAEFVRAGMRRARRGVAILARTALLESAGRYPLFFGEIPLLAIAPFFERVPMTLGKWDPKASTATAYAWFIWMRPSAAADMSRTTRRLIGPDPVVLRIPPGTRDRLSRREDARRFGSSKPQPLFDDQGGQPHE